MLLRASPIPIWPSLRQLPSVTSCSRSIRPPSAFHTSARKATSSTSPSIRLPRVADTPSPYYVTTPIFYVNAAPHIGHLHSCVLADVLSRWHQLRYRGWSPHTPPGEGVTRAVLATGTDEHGLKIQKEAETQGVTPKELCDRVSERFKALVDVAGVDYTTFIRTTDPNHEVAVNQIWKILVVGGFIYKGTHSGWYAVSDEAFYPQGQVRKVVDSKTGEEYHEAIESGKRVEWTEETNYKFKMSAFRDRLVEWLESNPTAILPPSRHAEVLEEVRSGLEDLSVSRPSSRLSWGVRVPNDPSQTIYVWIDALVNYLTVTGFPWNNQSSADDWQGSAWPADAHVVGKDIVRFHAIYWPCLLLATGIPLPRQIVTHSHWTVNKSKMSKSVGNVVDPFEEIKQYGLDVVRYYLCRIGGNLKDDSDYSKTTLEEISDKWLSGQLGNLLSRCMSPRILERAIQGAWEKGSGMRVVGSDVFEAEDRPLILEVLRPGLEERDKVLEEALMKLPDLYSTHLQSVELSQAMTLVSDVLLETNRLLQNLTPWHKSTRSKNRAKALYYTVESLRLTSRLLEPIMPGKMKELQRILGIETIEGEKWEDWIGLREVIRFEERSEKIGPLFPSRKLVQLAGEKASTGTQQQEQK